MLAIDNKSRKEDGTVPDSQIEKLRQWIQDYAMKNFFLGEVPVKWIRLELSMRQLQKEKITLKEAKAIGEKLEMTEEETNHALAFYHSVGEILHFTSIPELKETVILDVVWLVKLLKILINQSLNYKEQMEFVPTKVCGLIDELHHDGRLHEELLDHILKRDDRLEDKAILLATTEMYDILFRMPEPDIDTPVYYLPSLLRKDAEGKNGVICPAGSTSCIPLYFHFHGNFLPEGLFYRLVVRCLKQWPNQEMVLRQNKARIFIENEDFHVTLCKDGSDIALNALIMPGTEDRGGFKSQQLSNVRSAVEKELKHLIDTYTPNLKYKVCIKCRCPSHREGELLPGSEDIDDRCVAIREGKANVICKRSATVVLDHDLQLWYDEGKPTKDDTVASNVLSVANPDISQPKRRCNSIINVLAVGHEWSNGKGGLAAIHRLTSSLVAQTGQKVHATVVEANKEEQHDAASKGVQLIMPIDDEDTYTEPSLTWLTKYYLRHYPSLITMSGVNVVIGHLLTTSKAALEIQKVYFPGKKVILFNHVLPEDTEASSDEICKEVGKSDVVFSVGPRVYHHFENQFSKLRSVKYELFLPMPDEAFFQLELKKPSTECQPQILTYERIGNVTHLNGYDVIARSLSDSAADLKKLRPTLSPLVWKITGAQIGQAQSAHDYINEHVTSGYLDWKVVPNGSIEQIKAALQESHLCLVPSRVEPYGMFGLEAVAAGIPVLVNSNSGLAKFLKKYIDPDKAAAVIVDVGVTDKEKERDVRQWADHITGVFSNYDYAFKRAQDMKEMLRICTEITDTHTVFKRECCV